MWTICEKEYLTFSNSSHHHPTQKRWVMNALVERAIFLSETNTVKVELVYTSNSFLNNRHKNRGILKDLISLNTRWQSCSNPLSTFFKFYHLQKANLNTMNVFIIFPTCVVQFILVKLDVLLKLDLPIMIVVYIVYFVT